MLHHATPVRVAAVLAVITVLVLSAVIWHQSKELHKRKVYADVRKISNLQQIRLDIRQFNLKRGRLPRSLQELESDNPNPHFMRDDHFYDPDTLAPLSYQVNSADEYSLCADFHFPSEIVVTEVPDSGVDGPIWHHEAGHHCFAFAVATSSSNLP